GGRHLHAARSLSRGPGERSPWRYIKPYDQLLQADGQTLYIYDKDLNQVTERKLDGALGSSPAAILFGSNDLEKNFVVKNGPTRDGVEWLELTPRAKDTQFERIGIGFKSGNLVPKGADVLKQ
ncbi:lipoprotein chaperone, partial [Cupriavidus basilensis OR16]